MYQCDININTVITGYGISATAARLLYALNRLVIASRNRGIHDRRGVSFCYASKKTLAKMLDKSERTIARCITELKRAGLIESKRTSKNAHIYITYYGADNRASATNGSSANAKNGSSIYSDNEYKHNQAISIYQSTKPIAPEQPAASREGQQRAQAATVEAGDGQQQRRAAQGSQTRTHADINQRPAAPRAGAIQNSGAPVACCPAGQNSKERAAKRAKYKATLIERLKMRDSAWLIDAESCRQFEGHMALIDMIADTMSTEGGAVRVSGATISNTQYWETVKNIDNNAIDGIFDRIAAATMRGRVKNERAYILAAVYNAVQQALIRANFNPFSRPFAC